MKKVWIEKSHGMPRLMMTICSGTNMEIKETHLSLEDIQSLRADLEVAMLDAFREEILYSASLRFKKK